MYVNCIARDILGLGFPFSYAGVLIMLSKQHAWLCPLVFFSRVFSDLNAQEVTWMGLGL